MLRGKDDRMADGYLNFDTKINTDGFNKGIAAIGKMVKGTGSAVSGLGKAFLPVTAAVSGVGAAAVKTTIDFTKLYESTMVVFEKMLGGKQAADELYSSLLSIAKASTFSQEAFLTAGKKLVGMGINAQDTTKYMQAITDAVAGFGGTSENLTNVAENFAKISTAGRLSMEDVNMLSDNGIQALKILGNQYGMTTDEIRDMISTGAVPAKEAMDKLAEGIEKGTDGVNGMTAAMAGMSQAMKGKTLTGALDSLNSGFRGFALNLTGINPTLKETDEGYAESTQRLQQLTAAISTIAGIMPDVASVFSSFTDGIGRLLDKIVGANVAFNEATGAWEGIGGVLGKLKEQLDSMSPDKLQKVGDTILSMAAAGAVLPVVGGGIGKVGTAIEGISMVVAPAEKVIKGLPKAFQDAGKNVKGAAESFGNLKDAILLPLDDIKPKVSAKMGEILQGASALWNTGPGGKLTSAVSALSSRVAECFGQIGPALKQRFPGITNALSDLTSSMKQKFSGITNALSGLTSYMGAWGGTVGEALQGALKSVGNFAPGFIKLLKFGAIAGALVAGLGLLQGQFGEQITSFLQAATEKGPEVITNLCNGITAALPQLISQGAVLIQNLLQAITANAPAIIAGGIQVISGLITGIAQQLPTLIPMALQMVLTIVQSLLQNLPQLIQAGLQLIMGLAQGLINAVPMLIAAIPSIIQSLVSGIVQNLPVIIMTGIQLLVALVTGVIQAIPQLLAMIPEIFRAFIDGITSVNWSDVGKQIIGSIVDGIKSVGTNLWDAVKSIFGKGEGEAEEKGKSTGEKYAQGVDSTAANAQTSASNVALATTNSFAETMDANNYMVNMAAFNMGNTANAGLQLANVPNAFMMDAQAATTNMSMTLGANSASVGASAQNVGASANAGVQSANMPGTFNAAGTAAGQELGQGISNSSANVAGAANMVASAAQTSIQRVNLGGSYASAGQQAMQKFAGSIAGGSSAVTSATKNLINAVTNGLKSAQLPAKAKQEGTDFVKSLANAIRAGNGTIRTSVISVINAAKAATTGLSSSGYDAGSMFSAGLARGITSGKNGVAQAAAQVAQAAVKAAKENLDINSPSKVAIWMGKMFDIGMAKGLTDNARLVEEGTDRALRTMQRKAVYSATAQGSGIHHQASENTRTKDTDYHAILDEWERRQKRINQDRDERPVILEGRRVDRAMKKTGEVKV